MKQFIKNLFKTFGELFDSLWTQAVAMLVLFMLLLGGRADAQQFHSFDFLGGNRSVYITNNTTINFGDTNVMYTNVLGVAVFSNTNLYTTNALGSAGPYTTFTNASLYFGNAWSDVGGFSDRNGNAAQAAIGVSYIPGNARSTNSVTFTFGKLMISGYTNGSPVYVVGTQPSDKWSFALTNAASVANVATVTNIPTALMQGAAGLRLISTVTADNGAASFFNVTTLNLQGYTTSN